MGGRLEPLLALGLILLSGFATKEAHGETCYSKHSGFTSCPNGCCGPDNDQECCSQIFLIVGLAVGAVVIGVVVVVLLVCWVCKDCPPKFCTCCRGRGRRGERGRRERHDRRQGRHGHARRVLVHPVQPPDYNTATQERAPSVQPGLNHRILPLSPPPPYSETLAPSLLQQNSPRGAKITTSVAPAASLFVVGHVGNSTNRQDVSENVTRQSSEVDVNASSNDTVLTIPRHQDDRRDVPSLQRSPGSQSNHNPLENSINNRSAVSQAALRTTSRAENATPREAQPTNSPTNSAIHSDHIICVRETPRTGDSHTADGGSTQGFSHGTDNASDQPVLHTVREHAEEVDQLDLI